MNYLRRGIQLDRGRSEGYYNLGIAYRKLGYTELAIDSYQKALQLNPGMVEAVYNLANVYFSMEVFDEAPLSQFQGTSTEGEWRLDIISEAGLKDLAVDWCIVVNDDSVPGFNVL